MEATFDFKALILRLREKSKEGEKADYQCSECSSEMIRRKSKWGTDKFWWGCSNYPRWKHTEKA